ncbi:UbiA family prenyltransferase [Methanobacterium oryzae]|uniref:UbiA family prenyltransferase n=1 Tax=Methanobacterium oryzae TaxID=69540 RepID=UPI003D201938
MQTVNEKTHVYVVINKLIDSSYGKIEGLISFILSSSLYMSLNGFLKAYYSFLLYGLVIKWDLLLATFLSVFAVYCMNRLTDKEEDAVNSPERANFVNGNEKIIGLILFFSYFTSIVLGFLENIFAMLILLFPLCAGIAYNIKISPKIPRLKDIFAVKNIITALSWAVGTAFLPLTNSSGISLILIISLFYFFFIKSFVNTVLYDIRDIEGDIANGIKTIPVGIGKLKTKKLLLILTSSLIPVSLILLLINEISLVPFITMVFCIFNAYWYINYTCNSTKIHKYKMPLLINGEWFFVLGLWYTILPI